MNLAGKGSQEPYQALPHMEQPGIMHSPNYSSPGDVCCSPGLLLFSCATEASNFKVQLVAHQGSRSQNYAQKSAGSKARGASS